MKEKLELLEKIIADPYTWSHQRSVLINIRNDVKQLELRETQHKELIKLLSRCEKTFGVLDELIELLKVCKNNELPDAVKTIDIDFKLMQAEIKDAIQ